MPGVRCKMGMPRLHCGGLASRGTLNLRDERFCAAIRQGAEETLEGYRSLLLSDGATRQWVQTIVERAFGRS